MRFYIGLSAAIVVGALFAFSIVWLSPDDPVGNCVAPVITIPPLCAVVNVSHTKWGSRDNCENLYSIVDYQCTADTEEIQIEQLKGIAIQWGWQATPVAP